MMADCTAVRGEMTGGRAIVPQSAAFGDRIRLANRTYNFFPVTPKHFREFFNDLDRDIGLAVFNLLDVSLAQLNEIGQFCLCPSNFHPQSIYILANGFSPTHD